MTPQGDLVAQATIVVASVFALAFAFRAIVQRTNFCTMGSVANIVSFGDWTRMRQWLLRLWSRHSAPICWRRRGSSHPNTLQEAFLRTNSGRMESLSFVAPVAYTIDYLMFYSDTSKVITIGIAAVLGMIAGSAAYALLAGKFRWEGFRDTEDTANQLVGAALIWRCYRAQLHGRPGLIGCVDAGGRFVHRSRCDHCRSCLGAEVSGVAI